MCMQLNVSRWILASNPVNSATACLNIVNTIARTEKCLLSDDREYNSIVALMSQTHT